METEETNQTTVDGPSGRSEQRGPVVVGTDGSAAAAPAIRWAAGEARTRGVALRILHSAPYAGGSTAGPGRDRAADVLTAAVAVARKAEPDGDVSAGWSADPPVRMLLRASRQAGLVVVGPGGGELPRDAAVGSTALDVSARAHCPVVVVRGRHRSPARERPVLVGIDDPELDAPVLATAFAEAARHSCTLVVLHAEHDQHLLLGRRPVAAAGHELPDALTELLDRCSASHPDAAVERRIVRAHPTTALLGAAIHARFAVVGCRGHSAPLRAAFGSTSRAMLRRSPVPVMVVPAGATVAKADTAARS